MNSTQSNRLGGRIPLREGTQEQVWEALAGFGFDRLEQVGDTTPFSREQDAAEAELIQDGRGLAWLDYREVPAAEEQHLFSSLPRLKVREIAGNLQSQDAARRRLGLRQAGLLIDDSLAEQVVALTRDSDPLVAEDAKALCRDVYGGRLSTPEDAYQAFDATLDAHDRRQVLRWMMYDQEASNAAIEAVLQAALVDPDWEVRASALIAVARFRVLQLTEQVAACPLPRVSRLGPVRLDRQMLYAVKQAVLWSFSGESLEQSPPDGIKPWRWWHIRRLVLGLPPADRDHAFLLVHSLTTPLPAAPRPAVLPPGVEETSTGFRLSDSDMELAWVPPLPHWLGDEGIETNPLRRYTPDGFFITRDPVRQGETPLLTDYAAAQQQLQALGMQVGARLSLPTVAQWEATARGPDGRRFPWGNGHDATWFWRASPWGLLNLYGEPPCWCESRQLAGGERVTSVAAAIRRAEVDDRASLRPVVLTD